MGRALTLDPRFVDAHLNLGNIRRQQGRFDAALSSYDHAIRLRPENPGGPQQSRQRAAGHGSVARRC
ncbi:MAG: tetratricopeptide repeat protein [Pseudomonadota bacterium]